MKADDIIDAILTRLKGIKKTAGYSTTVVDVLDYWPPRPIGIPLVGVTISVIPGTMTPEFKSTTAAIAFTIGLECLLPVADSDNPRRSLNGLIRDVLIALGIADTKMVQKLLGGLVASMTVGDIAYAPPEGGSGHVRALIPLTVTFTEKFEGN